MSSTASTAESAVAPVADVVSPGAPTPSFFERAEALLARTKARSATVAAELSPAKMAEHSDPVGEPATEPAIDRAAEILDRTGETIGRWATAAALQVRRAAALVREEGEDMLAEAQVLRKKP